MAHSTQRLTAALDGRYRIERELGAGGMATVYLAHDLKHDRKVAVKVLKPELAAVLGAERFVVEIKTTAALQHPHILPLFDSGEADGFLYYVMPYIEGETLRSKLSRESQLGVEDAVRLTSDIADALHYAHEHGVIHRDIKPENILLQNGRPMVADFGIALAVSAAAGGRMTETGLSLGTPHYMSPEQATAEKEITARSDVYSLASVLYEMLTGNPPHTGATAQQIIMKIITEEAQDVSTLRKSVPAHVADAVAQALEKLPADRFASAAAFAAALNASGTATSVQRRGGSARTTARHAPAPSDVVRWRLAAIAASVVAALAIGFALFKPGRPSGAMGRVEFTYRPLWPADERAVLDISPDGQRIIQVVKDEDGNDFVALRELRSTTMTRVPGTNGARDPRFTQDGAWITFEAQGQIRKVPVAGGAATLVLDSVGTSGAATLDDGSVVAFGQDGLVRQLPGQAPERITTVDTVRGEFAHWYPEALPGGKFILFNSYASPLENSFIEAVELSTGKRTVLVKGAIYPRYSTTGHLLFARGAAIFAVNLDAKTLELSGPEVPVVEDVAWSATDGVASYAVSENGTLVYLRGSEATQSRRVMWSDRAGNLQPAVPETAGWSEPRLSPDGRWIALTRNEPRREIWLYDNVRRVLSQLTRNPFGVSFSSVWMPDSRSLLFAREVPQYDIYRQALDGTEPTPVFTSRRDKVPLSISGDGRTVATMLRAGSVSILLGDTRDGTSQPLDSGSIGHNTASLSSDGRWLAYTELSTEQRPNVFVRPVAGGGGRRSVSADGGDQPLFTRGGREIVYRKGDAVYAVTFNPSTGDVGTPSLLFRAKDAGRLWGGVTVGYDVTPDGSRFLLVVPVERLDATPNVVVLNWADELSRLVPRP